MGNRLPTQQICQELLQWRKGEGGTIKQHGQLIYQLQQLVKKYDLALYVLNHSLSIKKTLQSAYRPNEEERKSYIELLIQFAPKTFQYYYTLDDSSYLFISEFFHLLLREPLFVFVSDLFTKFHIKKLNPEQVDALFYRGLHFEIPGHVEHIFIPYEDFMEFINSKNICQTRLGRQLLRYSSFNLKS